MATLSDIGSFARAQAQTDTNGLTNANLIIFANEGLLDFHRKLIAHGIDASQTQEAYRNGTANQGTYLYPTDMFFLKAVEANYTDTTAQNYITVSQMDASNIPDGKSFSWLRTNQSTQYPLFDDRGDQFEIFPTPLASNNLTSMFRIFYFLEPTEYAAVGNTITYPVSLDYRLLGWRIAMSYYYSLNKMTEGDAFNAKYEEKVNQIVKTLGRGVQSPMQAIAIQASGWNF